MSALHAILHGVHHEVKARRQLHKQYTALTGETLPKGITSVGLQKRLKAAEAKMSGEQPTTSMWGRLFGSHAPQQAKPAAPVTSAPRVNPQPKPVSNDHKTLSMMRGYPVSPSIDPKAVRAEIARLQAGAKDAGQYLAKRATTTDLSRVNNALKDPSKTLGGAKNAAATVAEAVQTRQFSLGQAKSVAKDTALLASGLKGGIGLALLGGAVASGAIQAYRQGGGLKDIASGGGREALNFASGGALDTYAERIKQGDNRAVAAARALATFGDTRFFGGVGQKLKDMAFGKNEPLDPKPEQSELGKAVGDAGNRLSSAAAKQANARIGGRAGVAAGLTAVLANEGVKAAVKQIEAQKAEQARREAHQQDFDNRLKAADHNNNAAVKARGKPGEGKPAAKVERISYTSPVTGKTNSDATPKQIARWEAEIAKPNKNGFAGAPQKKSPKKSSDFA